VINAEIACLLNMSEVIEMRRLTARALLLALIALSGPRAIACGDKLLAIGRGVRFQHLSAARQAQLVIYCAGAERGPLSSIKLQTTLKKAVHRVQVVQDRTQLDDLLKAGQVDVILVEDAELAAITRHLQVASSRPAILPILVKPSKAEFAAAQKAYGLALKASADEAEYLTAIDEVMKAKANGSGKS
jgi:hypothetical protein